MKTVKVLVEVPIQDGWEAETLETFEKQHGFPMRVLDENAMASDLNSLVEYVRANGKGQPSLADNIQANAAIGRVANALA